MTNPYLLYLLIKNENTKKEIVKTKKNTNCHDKCRLIMAYNYYDKRFLEKCIHECDNMTSHKTHT